MPTLEPTRFPIETRFQAALNAMRNPGFLKSPRYQEQQKRALREGAHPHILEFERKLVKRLAELGVPVFAHCVVRTPAEQADAYMRGVSKVNPFVGPYPHQAWAVDIIHGVFGWMDSPAIPHSWDLIGHLGKEVAASMQIKIVWGGDWNVLYDPAHFELADWKHQASA